jgi:L-ascorbate metabolism protein UlaG (beta-lactamase superfamily)
MLTDPLLRDRLGHLRRRSASVPASEYHRLDAVLISHLHFDHLDVPSLRMLSRDVTVLAPRGGGGLVRRLGFTGVREMEAGDRVEVGGVEVVAVPAEHSGRRGLREAAALGYVAGGIYFAGDTDLHDEMSALGPLDVALLPVWGWGPSLGPGHLDPESAARALALLRPRIAVPIHWGTMFPVGLARFRGDRLTAPPLEFARHAARLAPDVRVEILQPGATLDVDFDSPRSTRV